MSDPQHEAGAWVHTVRAEDMIPWVDALRDPNAIHRDPAAAAALGLPARTVNPGPLNLAYALNLVAQARPEPGIARIEARFGANVQAGDVVAVSGGEVEDGIYRVTVRGEGAGPAVDVVVHLRTSA